MINVIFIILLPHLFLPLLIRKGVETRHALSLQYVLSLLFFWFPSPSLETIYIVFIHYKYNENSKTKSKTLECWNSVTTQGKKLTRRHREKAKTLKMDSNKENLADILFNGWDRLVKHHLKGQ